MHYNEHERETVMDIDIRKFTKMLLDNGYEFVRQSGSHRIFSNGTNTVVANTHLNRMVAKRLIRENNLNKGKLSI